MANTPPRQQQGASAATSPPVPGERALTREDYSGVATAVACEHSASVVLVHHVASGQLTSHGTGFIVWSSEKDYLILTANHVIELEDREINQVEIVVKMSGTDDYLPATVLRIDAPRDIALLRVTNNDGNSKTRRPLTFEFDDRLPPPVGTVVVLLGYYAPDGDVEGQVLVWPDVPGSSPGKIISDAFESVAEGETSTDIDQGLDQKIKANCPSIEGCSGSPLIVDRKVVGLLTSGVHGVDVYRTVPTLKAVFQIWLPIEDTDQRSVNDLIPLLAALEAE